MALSTLPALSQTFVGKIQYLYLVVSEETVNIILVREFNAIQTLVYFIFKSLAIP